jgi:orotate phosphoribosyltransferase-like protein
MERTPPFREAVGIPTGGTKLGDLLNEHATGNEKDPVCIVDDVLTTGGSMEYFLTQYQRNRRPFTAIGWVVFARGQCPGWVTSLFQMPV